VDALKLPDKPFDVSKRAVWEAYEKVRANRGAPGVDEVSLGEFDLSLDIWLSTPVCSRGGPGWRPEHLEFGAGRSEWSR
jgi:hypothetical protein